MMKQIQNLCIISPNNKAYSETFIGDHKMRLPAKIFFLYGGYFPSYEEDGKPLDSGYTFRRIYQFSLNRILKRPWDDYLKERLKDYLIKQKVEAVLAEYGPTGVKVMEACHDLEIPLITHFFGADAYRRDILENDGKLYSKMFEYASAVVAVSRDMENQLLRLGVPREKLYYNPCGVDLEIFQEGRPEQAPPVFLSVGRFVDKKAPFLTVLAFKRALERNPEVRLVMIGDGPLLDSTRRLAQAIGLSKYIDFRGACTLSEVALAMRQSRAFVQHSVTAGDGDREGTPVAILEACASGLPVIATRHAGIKDVVVEGVTGLLVDEGDVEGMAEDIKKIAGDPLLAAKLGLAGRIRIQEKYPIENSIQRLWDIISSTIMNSDHSVTHRLHQTYQ